MKWRWSREIIKSRFQLIRNVNAASVFCEMNDVGVSRWALEQKYPPKMNEQADYDQHQTAHSSIVRVQRLR